MNTKKPQKIRQMEKLIVNMCIDCDGPDDPCRILDVLKGHLREGFDKGVLKNKHGDMVCHYKWFHYDENGNVQYGEG